MLLEAIRELNLDLKRSLLRRPCLRSAGWNLSGVQTLIHVLTGHGQRERLYKGLEKQETRGLQSEELRTPNSA